MAANPNEDDEDEATVQAHPFDWRTRLVTTTTSDMPAAYPGGPAHQAGAFVGQSTPGKDADGRNVSFPTPSAISLAFSRAMKAAARARELQAQIEMSDVITPWGPGIDVTHESTAALYDYFEECMTVLAFSFQALEAFCNEVISYKVTATYPRRYRDAVRHLTADELERVASTEEKLAAILPDLLGPPTRKGTALGEDFVKLKRARDATIHIKSRDSAPRVTQPSDLDFRTLFHQFLGADPFEWVKTAVAMIVYFGGSDVVPMDLEHVKRTLGLRTKRYHSNQSKRDRPARGKLRPMSQPEHPPRE
jgi:hypothetical protein